ncbi:MAG: prepilin-type N-terminal cleavage/methylation domain-containing protein [Pirellulales bacterium]|nr:prepilin-type N-terminal cleavage/methylation domain-containing protein [Pirellulales bacterium]
MCAIVVHPRRPLLPRGNPRLWGARRSGFTLVELVISVLILGILTSTAAPKFAAALQRFRVTAACRRIKADLALSRQAAMAQSTTQSVQFTPGSGAYSLSGLGGLDRPSAAYTVDLALAPYNVRILSAPLGGDATVQFDYFGQPDSGGVITVGCGAATAAVTIDSSTGLASIP